MTETIASWVMIMMLVTSVVTDLRTGKIYNWLTMPGILIGMVLAIFAGGQASVVDHLFGLALVLAVVVLLSPIVRLGGGDTKLLMAVGALQGVHFMVWAMFFIGIAGGGLALAAIIKRRAVKQTAANMITNVIASAAGSSTDLATGSVVGKMPYSLAIAVGVLAALAMRA